MSDHVEVLRLLSGLYAPETPTRAALDAAIAALSAPQPPSGGEVSFDRRFADMLIGILGDVQDELGFTDEEKLCANGSAEIVSAIREMKERAASAPPSAPVGLSSEDRVVLMRLKDALPDVGLNGWIDGVRVIERILAQQPAAPSGAAESAEPAVWVAADTLHSPHPKCISSLAYMSQLDRERGREYVPLYTAPQQPADVDGMVMVQASDLKTLAEFADRGMRGNPAKLAALRAKAILAAQQQGGA